VQASCSQSMAWSLDFDKNLITDPATMRGWRPHDGRHLPIDLR
jgi:hypothetical protein